MFRDYNYLEFSRDILDIIILMIRPHLNFVPQLYVSRASKAVETKEPEDFGKERVVLEVRSGAI